MADPAVPAFSAAAREYDAWFEGEGRLVFQTEARALEAIQPSLPRPWLDVGAGSGRFATALGMDAGIEPAPGLARIASRRAANVALANAERQPFRDETFGTAFLILTLCFASWPLSVLSDIRRVLVPRGKIVLGMVPSRSPWGALYQDKKGQGHPLYRYASLRTYSETIAMLEHALFAIQGVVSTLLQKPGEVTAVESPRTGFQPGAGFVAIVAARADYD